MHIDLNDNSRRLKNILDPTSHNLGRDRLRGAECIGSRSAYWAGQLIEDRYPARDVDAEKRVTDSDDPELNRRDIKNISRNRCRESAIGIDINVGRDSIPANWSENHEVATFWLWYAILLTKNDLGARRKNIGQKIPKRRLD
jgi:hypothetical protein